MSTTDFERVRAVFLAARDLDEEQRALVLGRECGSERELRTEVESLLAHHDAQRDQATRSVLGSAIESILDPPPVQEESLPRSFGGFELQEVIGRGGMGTVYRARQRRPDRPVALKVIRPGMLSTALLGRFRYEVDVLARLEHPGIARIYEAGTVEVGGREQPYFALELVSGQPIDEYAAGLGLVPRLELLVKVCDAVQHAHQKGVIHRDLKPANILVEESGAPKVLDFGVARATDADVRTTTVHTNAGQLVGTLPYMSPEQVSGDPRRLDVRSDVYALGVLMFELLTGRPPYELRDRSLADAALTIRDAEPRRLAELDTTLRGDLETITAKTLEKEPSRRYQSAAALAEDLRRYLAHQPIIARPPSMVYQLRLFARRHRGLVTGVVLGIAALLLATVVSIAFAVHAQRAAERESKQRLIAERTNTHLESILTLPDPHRQGEELSISDVLELMIARLDAEPDLPEVEARVRGTIGRTYVKLGRSHLARRQLEHAAELWHGIDPNHIERASVLTALGVTQRQLMAPDLGEGSFKESIAILEGHEHPDAGLVYHELVASMIRLGKFGPARPIAAALVTAAREQNQPINIISRLRALRKIDSGLGRHADAQRSLEEALQIARLHLDTTHPAIDGIHLDLIDMREAQGDLEGALEASRRAWDTALTHRSPASFNWMVCLNRHTDLLLQLDRRSEFVDVMTRSTEAIAAHEGPDHRLVRDGREKLARTYERWGEPDQARQTRATVYDGPAPTAPSSRPASQPSSPPG